MFPPEAVTDCGESYTGRRVCWVCAAVKGWRKVWGGLVPETTSITGHPSVGKK